MPESSSNKFPYIKKILIITGVLNILEGFHVLFQKIPCSVLKYDIDYIIHSIFHFIVGVLMLQICSKSSLFLKKNFILFIGAAGTLFIVYSIIIIITRQNAVKFGYQILFTLHAAYYFILGLFLLSIFYRLVRSRPGYRQHGKYSKTEV